MEPLPETLAALEQLSSDELDLVETLRATGSRIVDVIPDCAGLSISCLGVDFTDIDLTFTLMSTDAAINLLDAAQYLDDAGPCMDAMSEADPVDAPDVLAEERWHLLGLAAAGVGVRSTLSLPMRSGGEIIGSVNFYGATTDTFKGHEKELAHMFGAAAEEAVANADLSMTSRDHARRAPDRLEELQAINVAAGVLSARDRLPVDEARRRISGAAERAGVAESDLAHLVISRASA